MNPHILWVRAGRKAGVSHGSGEVALSSFQFTAGLSGEESLQDAHTIYDINVVRRWQPEDMDMSLWTRSLLHHPCLGQGPCCIISGRKLPCTFV